MRKAGKMDRFKANVAWAMLCIHLFGMLVTNVLHPLYHAHAPSYSCYSGTASSTPDETTGFSQAGKETSHAQASAGHSCTLCQWKVLYEFVCEAYRDNTPCILVPAHTGGYIADRYHFDPPLHKHPRAPPFFC